MSRMLPLSVGALLMAMAAAQPPAMRKGVSVRMPVTANAVAVPDGDRADSLVVAVTFGGSVYLEVTRVTPAQLSGKLKAELDAHPGRRVYLKADARAPYSMVAEVLDALRTARVSAPILLTDQHDSTDTAYVPPKGLEVLLTPHEPGAVRAMALQAGSRQASDSDLKQHVRQGKPVVLRADEKTPYDDVVHAVDVCRAAGAKVFLATPKK